MNNMISVFGAWVGKGVGRDGDAVEPQGGAGGPREGWTVTMGEDKKAH